MNFADEKHEERFRELITKAKVNPSDTERLSLFYVLAYNNECYNHVTDLYDFKDDVITAEGLNKGWQTSTSRKFTKLGYNLYNGFNEEEHKCDILNITCGLGLEDITIVFRAVAIRNDVVNIFARKNT